MEAPPVTAKYGCAGVMRSAMIVVLLMHCHSVSGTLKEWRNYGVYLTVSSFTNIFDYGQFQVNWFGIPETYFGKTYIGLCRKSLPRSKLLAKWLLTNANGKRTTWVDAPQFDQDSLMKGQCLGYYAALVKKTETEGEFKVILSSCFSSRPHWMRRFCCTLSNLTLKEMLIPGTHNSGMYNLGYAHPHEKLYLYNQDQTIRRQLAYGIRALDMRVQYYYDQFYVTHDTIRGWVTIREVLRDVRWFVEETGELVLLDFHRFTTGFEDTVKIKRHEQLQALIVEELEGVLLNTSSWSKTFGDIFGNCKKREPKDGHVIAFYNDFRSPQYMKYFEWRVTQKWPNAQDSDSLFSYIDKQACEKTPVKMIGIMAELTAKFPTLIVGNRVAAELINHRVTEYFRRHYDSCRGIVYTDFFLGNYMIDVAIKANLAIGNESRTKKGRHCHSDLKKEQVLAQSDNALVLTTF